MAEPVLASLSGGGFTLAQNNGNTPKLFDFFVQTPRKRRHAAELDFHPVTADFGTAQQEFHIGYGAAATPGAVKGMFAIHQRFGSMPMRRLVEPAIELTRNGVVTNNFQGYLFEIVHTIFTATPETRRLYASLQDPQRLAAASEILKQPALADTLEVIAREGEAFFYQSEIATAISSAREKHGGHLTRDDLRATLFPTRRCGMK